VQERAKESV
jgi:hypothetical protein